MKRFLSYAITGFSLLNSFQAFGLSLSDFSNPFVDIPRFNKWKSDMEGKIGSTFALMVPENERSQWKMLNGKPSIGDINEYAKGSWIPRTEESNTWSEQVICYFEYLQYEKGTSLPYRSINEFIESYKSDGNKSDGFKFEIKSIKINGNEAILEIDRYEMGPSGLIKNSTLLKILERWILSGNWLIALKYEMDPSADAEKGNAWEHLRSTWLQRFSQVHFGS